MWELIWMPWIRLEAIDCPNECEEYLASWQYEHLNRMIESKNRREEWNNKILLY